MLSEKENSEEREFDDQDAYVSHEFTVDKGQEPLRMDKFLMNRLEDVSRNKVQIAAHAGNILVNGCPVKPNYKVKPGDQLRLILPEAPRQLDLLPENIPLNIIYEDEDVIVLNKQSGLVVHPGFGNFNGTLVNALLYHFGNLPGAPGDSELPRPGLVHRLDKETSGLMVIARNDYAMTHLARQFFERSIERAYQALVWGNVEEDEGTIDVSIGRDLRYRKKMAAFPDKDQGKEAITDYTVLERFGYTTKVQCRLRTGRTHQIRVHFDYLGHTLFNDSTYGGDRIRKGTLYTKYKQFVDNAFALMPRQALHAKTLGFIHPKSGEKMYFDSELPPEFEALLDKWRKYSRFMKL